MRTNPINKIKRKRDLTALLKKTRMILALVIAFASVYFFFFKILFF
ncbi:MAG: hypothetical protein V4539_24020 [Bacteroidota bacterium]